MINKLSFAMVAFPLLVLSACSESPSCTQDPSGSLDISGAECHITLSSGLQFDAYELASPPGIEPLAFTTASGVSQEQVLATHAAERQRLFPDRSYFDGEYFGQQVEADGHELIAYIVPPAADEPAAGPSAQAMIEVLRDGEVIETVEAGDIAPISPLQGLWSYGQNWVLEYAKVTVSINKVQNTADTDAIGQLVINGVLMNEQAAYDEIFGFQLLNRSPFYFFEKNGEIGFSYDGEVALLGFEEIPHYGCCSAGMLNPTQAEQMVAFFAQKGDRWYYVEMGLYE